VISVFSNRPIFENTGLLAGGSCIQPSVKTKNTIPHDERNNYGQAAAKALIRAQAARRQAFTPREGGGSGRPLKSARIAFSCGAADGLFLMVTLRAEFRRWWSRRNADPAMREYSRNEARAAIRLLRKLKEAL
jgi:hypothetical protein